MFFSRQKLNKIIKALRDCGMEKVVRLPKIVVIGNQSSRKNSLLEATSRIKELQVERSARDEEHHHATQFLQIEPIPNAALEYRCDQIATTSCNARCPGLRW